jgi:hypothetical protein
MGHSVSADMVGLLSECNHRRAEKRNTDDKLWTFGRPEVALRASATRPM